MSEEGGDKKEQTAALDTQKKQAAVPSAPVRGLRAWAAVFKWLLGMLKGIFMFFMRPFCTILWMAVWALIAVGLIASLLYPKEMFAVVFNATTSLSLVSEHMTWSNLELAWMVVTTNAQIAAYFARTSFDTFVKNASAAQANDNL